MMNGVGRTEPVNNQPYVPFQDFYVIKGQVLIENVSKNGQTYYVIDADKINPADIAGFFAYWRWVNNFVTAINTQGHTQNYYQGTHRIHLGKPNRNSSI